VPKQEVSWSEDPTLPVDSGIGEVDFDPDEEELPEQAEEEQPITGEGAAASSSAPAEALAEEGAQEEGFEQVVRKRGSRGGSDVKKKACKKNFYQQGVPAAKNWLYNYTSFNCKRPFRLTTPYLTETPDFTPLVRYLGHFDPAEAQQDPTLAIARFLKYNTPGLKGFLFNNCPRLLQEAGQLVRDLQSDFRDKPLGSNPLDKFEGPEPRGGKQKADFEGAGAQFQRDLDAGRYPELLQQEAREVLIQAE